MPKFTLELKPFNRRHLHLVLPLRKELGAGFVPSMRNYLSVGRYLTTGEVWKVYAVYYHDKLIGVVGYYHPYGKRTPAAYKAGNVWLGWFGILKAYRCHGHGAHAIRTIVHMNERDFAGRIFNAYTDADNDAAGAFYHRQMKMRMVGTVAEYRKEHRLGRELFGPMDNVVYSAPVRRIMTLLRPAHYKFV